MHMNFKPLAILALFIIFISINVFAQDNDSNNININNTSIGFVVTTSNRFVVDAPDTNVPITNPDDQYATSGLDGIKPVWEARFSSQIAYISATILLTLGALLSLPFIWGRLKHALENPKTREILCFIQRNPGVTIAELSKRQNINRGTLKYHLSQLLSNDKITFIKKGKFARVFYNTSSPMDIENIISMYLKNENTRKILFKIMDNPGISNQELSSSFELAKSTTHEYIKKMSEDDILEFRQDGKFKRCYIKQDAHMVLLRYKPN